MKKLVIAWAALVLLIIGVLLWQYVLDLPEKNPDFAIHPEKTFRWNEGVDHRSGWTASPHGKPFELRYIALNRNERNSFFQIYPTDGGTLYLDLENSKLEKRTLGVWQDAPAQEGFDSAIEKLTITRGHGTLRGTYFYTIAVRMYLGELEKPTDRELYRLTIAFTENEDGTGERYELKLRIEA